MHGRFRQRDILAVPQRVLVALAAEEDLGPAVGRQQLGAEAELPLVVEVGEVRPERKAKQEVTQGSKRGGLAGLVRPVYHGEAGIRRESDLDAREEPVSLQDQAADSHEASPRARALATISHALRPRFRSEAMSRGTARSSPAA